jgi:hypothetical protein
LADSIVVETDSIVVELADSIVVETDSIVVETDSVVVELADSIVVETDSIVVELAVGKPRKPAKAKATSSSVPKKPRASKSVPKEHARTETLEEFLDSCVQSELHVIS